MRLKGQLTQRFSGEPCDGIGKCRRQRRQAGFTHARGRFGARHDVDVEFWHVRDSRNRIVTEVALLDYAVFKRYC